MGDILPYRLKGQLLASSLNRGQLQLFSVVSHVKRSSVGLFLFVDDIERDIQVVFLSDIPYEPLFGSLNIDEVSLQNEIGLTNLIVAAPSVEWDLKFSFKEELRIKMLTVNS